MAKRLFGAFPNLFRHPAVELVPICQQFFALGQIVCRQVVRLADVVGQVVELPLGALPSPWVSQYLPVALAQCGPFVLPPKKGVVRDIFLFAAEVRNEVGPIQFSFPVIGSSTSQFCCGGEDVELDDRLPVNSALGQAAWPLQHERYSQASLVHAAFPVAQRLVAGGQFASWAAVVAQKKIQRLFFNFFMAQLAPVRPPRCRRGWQVSRQRSGAVCPQCARTFPCTCPQPAMDCARRCRRRTKRMDASCFDR